MNFLTFLEDDKPLFWRFIAFFYAFLPKLCKKIPLYQNELVSKRIRWRLFENGKNRKKFALKFEFSRHHNATICFANNYLRYPAKWLFFKQKTPI